VKPFEEDRRRMVRAQLLQQGIQDARVLDAMAEIPRHHFLDPERWAEAYAPKAVPIGHGQTISQPYMVAVMTELLELKGSEHVLEVGTGSGYQAAILAQLAGSVVSVERIDALARTAADLLRELAIPNVEIVVGDGTLGYAARAPYDRIIVTAAAPQLPASLLTQLADPGLLVCPVGDLHMQFLHVVRRSGGRDATSRQCACRFVPLLGAEGFGS
jgi:protein-L-isoaspartate(D-aspartate) O-methyltransferase